MAQTIMLLKYRRKLSMLGVLRDALMIHAGRLPIRDVEAVIPVPISFSKLMRRGFNQSAVLADPLAVCLGVPLLTMALKRSRGKPQVGLNRQDRELNASRIFEAGRDGYRVAGRRVLLFDDVYTTGATV